VDAPTCARVQVVELNVPEAAGAALKVTVPVGNDFVPESLSETTVVQVEAWPNATEAGLQVTVVEVERLVTVSAKVPELPACGATPAYVPVIVCVPVPTVDGVYVTEQDDDVAVGEPRVHDVPGLENAPAPLEPKVTDPVGADFVPEPVSVTVAVQTLA
jgi:hypothetical protein